MKEQVTIGIIQHAPVFLDTQKSLAKMEGLLKEAKELGAELVVFGESWLGGYPAWLDTSHDYARWDFPATKKVFAKMYQESVSIEGGVMEEIKKMVQANGLWVVLGMNEKVEQGPYNGTIFNSLLTLNPEGEILNHHRKLMPTYTEKLVYGLGDGKGLQSVKTPFGKLGGLICWEHWMPLARQAMHQVGEHIHVAVWPTVHATHQLASRNYAFEGRCFVIAVGQMLQAKDLPSELPLTPELAEHPEAWVMRGGSSIIAPDATYEMEPVFEREGILIHTLQNLARVLEERMTLDTSGHYNRYDVFEFEVSRKRK
ncbi:MAG: carbon-nitrogen hydrolase family protein [Bacteroidota bacterium]